MKHTPGPWQIADEDELLEAQTGDEPFGIWREDESGELTIVASIKTDVVPEYIRGNAHLIAAAPEMFEALEYASSALENLGIHDSGLRKTIDGAILAALGEK